MSSNWREFNDEAVTFCMTKNIQEHGYGGYLSDADVKIYSTAGESYSKTAYMLVYEKKLKSELR